MNYTIVIPNHYEDIIRPLLDSIATYEKDPNVLIIADRHNKNYGFDSVSLNHDKFIFSRAANTGIAMAVRDDIILVNDDVRLIQPDTFKRLHDIAYSDPLIGILSPLINGGCGNLFMMESKVNELWNGEQIMYRPGTGSDYLSFVCVYLKRSLINQIGFMDEGFVNYGRDDADMCIRAVEAGWKIAITRNIIVNHGTGGPFFERGKNWNASFFRSGLGKANQDYFYTKYPNAPRRVTWPHPFCGLVKHSYHGPDNWKQRIELHSKIEQS